MPEQYFANNRKVGDGETTVWDFSFAGARPDAGDGTKTYLEQTDVRVALVDFDEVGRESRTEIAFELIGPSQVLVEPAVPSGQDFVIYRETQSRFVISDFVDFASISERDLDDAFRQGLFAVQELRDESADTRRVSNEARGDSAAAVDMISEITGSEEPLRELVRKADLEAGLGDVRDELEDGLGVVRDELEDGLGVVRDDLAAPVLSGQGALLVRGATIYVNSVANLMALDTSVLVEGQQASVKDVGLFVYETDGWRPQSVNVRSGPEFPDNPQENQLFIIEPDELYYFTGNHWQLLVSDAHLQTFVDLASAQADRAETASDAAFINADAYATITEGRAAVADGEQFQVVGDDEIIRYRRDSASTHTEVARYPSSAMAVNTVREVVRTTTTVYNSTSEILPLSGFVVIDTGEFAANISWASSELIPVSATDVITVKAATHAQNAANIAFYDIDENYISGAVVGPNSTVATKEFHAPAHGFVRIGTRTATSTEFYLRLERIRLLVDESEVISKYDSEVVAEVNSNAGGGVVALTHAAQSTIETGNRDADGAFVSASSRRHRVIQMGAGDTSYFGGMFITGADLPAVVFVGASGAEVVIEGVERPSTVYPYGGEFTAIEAGTLYANQHNDVANEGLGYLFSDASGGVIEKEEYVSAEDIGHTVVSQDWFEVYGDALNHSGEFIDLTDRVELHKNKMITPTGLYEVLLPDHSAYDQFGVAFVPVRAGDAVRFYGHPRAMAGGITRAHQLDHQRNYIEQLLGGIPTPTYGTYDVVATADGYIAFNISLSNGTTLLNWSLSRQASSVIGDAVKQLTQDVAAVPAQISDAIDTGVEPIVRTVVAEEFEDIAGDAIEQLVSDAIAASDVSGITRVDSVMEKLPVRLSMLNGYNSQTYTQNNIVEGGGYQYIVGVDELRNPFIMRRSLLGGAWEIFDLSTIPGNPFDAPNQPDSHNNFVMAITRDGHLLISGNQHTSPCRCVVSDNPHDMTSWTEVPFTTSGVTYPRFLTHPDGTTLGFWRETDRSYYMSEFDDDTLTWGAKRLVIDQPVNRPEGAAGTRVYEQMLAIDSVGDLHLCWGYRAFPVAEGNFGMFYAKSSDKGLTFKSASGALSYSLPLTDVNSERIYTVNAMEGYVNQCGGCYDLNNRYHTVFWHNDPLTGFGRIMHVWFNGAVWKSEAVYHLDRQWPPNEGLLSGEFKRPHIICGQSGRLFVIYANLFQSADQIRAIDVTTEGSPQDFCIIKFGVRMVQLALNIEFPIKNNELVMMLSKGASGGSQTVWDNQGAYLVTVPLPVG